MELNRLVRPALLALTLALPSFWALHQADANFGSSDGFSGIGGVTCISCHQPPHPTDDTAQAHLEGLPATWLPGQAYPLTLRVTGGPPALPAPAPQGGFDLATDAGTLHGDPGTPALFRNPSQTEITYTPEGTLHREWHVIWTAPTLARQPAPTHFWLAVLAANGNHVVAANKSDGGETLDSTAALRATVPADAAALAAWRDLPLMAPTAHANRSADGWTVKGTHRDANATELVYRIDDGPWAVQETVAGWRLKLSADAHRFDYRSDGAGRKSPVQTLLVGPDAQTMQAGTSPVAHAPIPPLATFAALLFALAAASRRKP